MDLKNKTALVTGGASGLGLATVTRLVAGGGLKVGVLLAAAKSAPLTRTES